MSHRNINNSGETEEKKQNEIKNLSFLGFESKSMTLMMKPINLSVMALNI